ncbi:BLUF domain-containing protein [Aliamphritea hakodatensis]|uniref:BLUF domain-containing protein n=1 Tax=Aliamphritea hakodatensis TaxID=2895352 RepID=UPI0022FD478E|nr:BLUF domain-containing protein [Aliamphritea hakodatensis]
MSEHLKQFAYISHELLDFQEEDLRELLLQSRKKNKDMGLTGLLLFDKPVFMQVLEGPAASIDQIIADIRADKRHYSMDIIYSNDDLQDREFANWRMGCRILGNRTRNDYSQLDSRIRRLLSVGRPNGQLAHQILMEFHGMKDAFLDL